MFAIRNAKHSRTYQGLLFEGGVAFAWSRQQ